MTLMALCSKSSTSCTVQHLPARVLNGLGQNTCTDIDACETWHLSTKAGKGRASARGDQHRAHSLSSTSLKLQSQFRREGVANTETDEAGQADAEGIRTFDRKRSDTGVLYREFSEQTCNLGESSVTQMPSGRSMATINNRQPTGFNLGLFGRCGFSRKSTERRDQRARRENGPKKGDRKCKQTGHNLMTRANP